MRFALDIGDREHHHIELNRSPWFGAVLITVNGQPVAGKSPWGVFTHFNYRFVDRYEFTVGEHEKHQVAMVHERPLLWGGLRRQQYRVYVDGELAAEHYGY
jgi:hypothetical protein